MLSIRKNDFMNVSKVPMNTDYPLDLDNQVLPKTPFAMGLVGQMGSGKTNLLCRLILGGEKEKSSFYNKKFDRVYFVGNMKTINCKKKIDLPEEQVFETLTVGVLDTILESVKDSDESVLLIIDDQINQLKRPDIRPYMCKVVYNMRHLCASGDKCSSPHGLHIMITAQKYNKIPKELRTTLTHYAIFKPSKTDQKEFWEEHLSCDYNTWDSICRHVFDKKHNFIFYDGKQSKFHRNFDEIDISEHSEDGLQIAS